MNNNKIAITYTVKNESRLILWAVNYHLSIGFAKIYIFLDNSNDNTEIKLKYNDKVEVYESKKPNIDHNCPGWIAEIIPKWNDNMDVRKRINTYLAAKMACASGIEWIASIDPDEMIVPRYKNSLQNIAIQEFINNIPRNVDQVLLKNIECIPEKNSVYNPFVECTLFINRFVISEYLLKCSKYILRKITKNPKLISWYEYYYYKIRFFNMFSRVMINPIDKEKIPIPFYLGYTNYKSVIRTSKIKNFKFDIHRWVKFNKAPVNIKKGNIFHYDLFDCQYMIDKFKKRSSSMLVKSFYFRYNIGLICNKCNLKQIEYVFRNYISITDAVLIKKLIKFNILKRIDAVAIQFGKISE